MKFRSFIIFFLLLGVFPDLVITCMAMQGLPWWWKLPVCLPTLAMLCCIPLIGTGTNYTNSVRTYSYITFLVQLPKAVFALLFLAVKAAGKTPALIAALAGALATATLFLILFFFVSKYLKVSATELSFKDLPKAFDGLRICQLSDLHLGSFGKDRRFIGRIISAACALKPDIIFFTGDLVNFESENASPYIDELAQLEAPMGVFSIRGNHDYMFHGPFKGKDREEDFAKLMEMERGLGWTVLVDSNVILSRGGGEIAVAGVENTSSHPLFKESRGDLEKALEGLPEGIFKILLSHDPTHWRNEVVPRGDVQLTLSGHTHGLCYKLAGPHPSHWKQHESSGLYQEGGQALYVSPGLGSSFAFRLGGRPCIDILTLKSESYE